MYNYQINNTWMRSFLRAKDTCYTDKTSSCDKERLEERMRGKGKRGEVRLGSVIK